MALLPALSVLKLLEVIRKYNEVCKMMKHLSQDREPEALLPFYDLPFDKRPRKLELIQSFWFQVLKTGNKTSMKLIYISSSPELYLVC